jgi:hypothetical protein
MVYNGFAKQLAFTSFKMTGKHLCIPSLLKEFTKTKVVPIPFIAINL